MSRFTDSTTFRTLALAGAVLAAATAPTAAQAQDLGSDRTLLNHVATRFTLVATLDNRSADRTYPGAPDPVDGRVALLGAAPARAVVAREPDTAAIVPVSGTQMSGERALLGHQTPAAPRREGDE